MVSKLFFFSKLLELLTTGFLEIGKFPPKQSLSISQVTVRALHLTGFFDTTVILVFRSRAHFGQHQDSQPLAEAESLWTWPEVAFLRADQKERGLWRREWHNSRHNGKMTAHDLSQFAGHNLEDHKNTS